MKSIYAILIACASLTSTGSAEDLQSKQDKPSDAELKKSQRAAKSTYTIYEPNRIDRHGVVYRGTVPQAIKSRNPLRDNVTTSIGRAARVIHGDDPRVIEFGKHPSLGEVRGD